MLNNIEEYNQRRCWVKLKRGRIVFNSTCIQPVTSRQTLRQTGNWTSVKWVSFCIMKFIPSCCTKHNQISMYVIFFSICDENKIKGEANVDHLQWNRVTWLWSRHLSCHYPELDGIALENAKTVIYKYMHAYMHTQHVTKLSFYPRTSLFFLRKA